MAEYQVVHKNEARIRVRIPRLAGDNEYACKLKHLVESQDCVTQARINSAARSLAVEYDYKASSEAIANAQQKLFEYLQIAADTDIDCALTLQPVISDEQPTDDNILDTLKKAALLTVGILSLPIGIAGVILPLFPGTPFLILAALCFSWAGSNGENRN